MKNKISLFGMHMNHKVDNITKESGKKNKVILSPQEHLEFRHNNGYGLYIAGHSQKILDNKKTPL